MNWTYGDVLDLPGDVYGVLVEELRRELAAADEAVEEEDE